MMKRTTVVWVLILALLAATCSPALADEAITVTGSATVQLAPDMVMIYLGVNATSADVLTAQRTVNEAVNNVIGALTGEEIAIAAEDIATTEYYISERHEYNYETDRSEMTGYEATAMLSICVRDIAQAGSVIDAAMQAGANQLAGVKFISSDQTAARDQALALAVQDGIRKAKAIAGAAGMTLPALPSSITEEESYSYSTSNSIAMYDMEVSAASEVGTQLQAGMLSVTSNVTVSYEID